MRILIDTNILVDYFRSQRSSRPKNQRQAYCCQQAVQFIDQSIEEGVELLVSYHTFKELLQGITVPGTPLVRQYMLGRFQKA